jgi:cytochrome c oxidase assembly protein subunit 11
MAHTEPGAPDTGRPGRRRLTGLLAAGLVFGMVGLTFAASPLYRLFCQVTGYGGTTQRADAGADRVLDRLITIRFDANVDRSLGWHFAPAQRQVMLRVGETAEIAYQIRSAAQVATTGTAVFNVTPEQAGGYFNKIACFCFTEQTLSPGQTLDMPVVFFVDPAIADDPDLDYIDTITLSYTFYPVANPKPVAAAGGIGQGERL